MPQNADVIVIGAGLAGLVAAAELVEAGQHVIVLEQEPEASLGGQAHWSFGGLFLVDTPEQRRLGIKDSHDLARQDWYGSAEFDRDEDENAREWAEAYLAFAAGEKREWLRSKGVQFFPVVGWAERGGYTATGHGNSVPRFHIVWGTGPGILEPFIKTVRDGRRAGAGRAEVPPPGRRAHRAQGRGRRREGLGARARRRRARRRQQPGCRGRLLVRGPGRHRGERRHRRQPRPGAQELAGVAGHTARRRC